MADIIPWIAGASVDSLGSKFEVHERFAVSRVPCVGEFVYLGDDASGPRDYRVVLVRHYPKGEDSLDDADVYLVHVSIIDVLRELSRID